MKTKNNTEYFRITHDSINFSQNKTKAICSEKTKNNTLNAIHITIKFLESISFIVFILFSSHLLFNSEKTGKSNQNMGQTIMKATPMILK